MCFPVAVLDGAGLGVARAAGVRVSGVAAREPGVGARGVPVMGPVVGGTVGALTVGAVNDETTVTTMMSRMMSPITAAAARKSPRRRFGCGLLPTISLLATNRTRQSSRWESACVPLVPGHARSLQCAIPSVERPPLFLKSLEIAGFKSFARPVRLEFPRGITGFVGPNGSGKSNVVDAVRWCLGEQSARDLRAQRAEDVIYAGPRKVLGAAEVTLTFESEQGDDFPQAELAVGRRLYRSGESDYLLNGQKARLRDLTSALRLLGIDSGRNLVVTQGMADALLSASPSERRGLLEQAAGLGPYRERRDEAKQKLATTTHNIAAIEAVLAEMEPRLRLLRRQARAVQDRDEARTLFRQRSQEWFSWRWGDSSRRVEQARREVETAARVRAERTRELHDLEREAEVALERERAHRRALEEAIGALHTAERERDAVRHELQRLEQARQDTSEKLNLTRARQAMLIENREAVAERIALVERSLHDLDHRAADLREAEHRAEAAWTHAREASRDLATRAQSLLAARQNIQRRHASGVECLRKLRVALEEDQQRSASLGQRLAEARGALTTAEETIQHVDEETHAAEAAVGEVEEAAASARQALDAAQRRHGRLVELERRVRRAHSDVRALATTLSRSVESLQAAAFGPISRLQALPGWDDAISAALRDWAFLPRHSEAEMRSLPTEAFFAWRAGLGKLPPGTVWADSVVTGFPGNLVHPLLLTVLADSNEVAEGVWDHLANRPAYLLGWPSLTVVAKDGTIHEASGVRKAQTDERTARYLRSKRALDAAGRRDAILCARCAGLAAGLGEATRTLEARRTESDERARKLVVARRDLTVLAERRLRAERARDAARDEQRERGTQLARVQDVLRQRDAEQGALEAAQQTLDDELRAATEAWQRGQEAADTCARQTNEAAARRASVRQEMETLAATRAGQAELLVHAQQELRRIDGEVVTLDEDRGRFDAHLHQLSARITEVRPLDALEQLVIESRQRVDALRQREVSLAEQTHIQRARDSLSSLIANHERTLAALSHLEEERRRLREEIEREMNLDPKDLPAAPESAPREDEIRRLRTRATQYADADPSVIEESHDLAERQDQLRANLEDLQRAVETLAEMMSEADAEMRKRFDRAFSAVNQEFSRVFQVMLRGGEANLERTGEDGVDIRARLPGRRARSSAAFSGGERSLVASALLFGVLKIRPTPFCLLDEVDAALDESNVDRYLAVLRDIGQRTQIMVVTHNRATMAAADVLYGLTMNDEGISNVLSLRLDAYATA